jgi:hypothetical protein
MGEALDDATEYGNARRGYAACALTDVLHAQFELALARFNAGELDYANEVEDVLRKVPEQRRQISALEDRSHGNALEADEVTTEARTE